MSSSDEESMEEERSTSATAAVVMEGGAAADGDDASAADVMVASVMDDDDDDDDDDAAAGHADVESMAAQEEDDEIMTIKSERTAEDEASVASKQTSQSTSPKPNKRSKKAPPKGSKKTRSPAVKGLTIPFRNVKRTMKLDPDIGTVQNEAAIMATAAAELFIKSLAKESFQNAKSRGRGTIRYEDIAEARSKDPSLAFLETLLP